MIEEKRTVRNETKQKKKKRKGTRCQDILSKEKHTLEAENTLAFQDATGRDTRASCNISNRDQFYLKAKT
jgi:hypothetical protein